MGGGRFSARVEHHAAYELFMAVYGSLRDKEHGNGDGSDPYHADEPASPCGQPAGVARFRQSSGDRREFRGHHT